MPPQPATASPAQPAVGAPLVTVAAQVGLFPAARLTEAFERRFGIAPQLFREMHVDFQHPRLCSGGSKGRRLRFGPRSVIPLTT